MPGNKHGDYVFGTVKVGEKGQIVIPKEARDVFDIKPGDTLIIAGRVGKGIIIPSNEKLINTFQKIIDKEMK